MRGRCGWSRFRLFAGSARIEGNAMLLDFDPTVIAIGSSPFWLRWSEGSGRPWRGGGIAIAHHAMQMLCSRSA
jgi:hypothetical protein